jgi:hypothetical protein
MALTQRRPKTIDPHDADNPCHGDCDQRNVLSVQSTGALILMDLRMTFPVTIVAPGDPCRLA